MFHQQLSVMFSAPQVEILLGARSRHDSSLQPAEEWTCWCLKDHCMTMIRIIFTHCFFTQWYQTWQMKTSIRFNQGPQDKAGMVCFARCRLPWTGSIFRTLERFPAPQTLLQVACINLMLQSTADVNAKDCITTNSADPSCTYDPMMLWSSSWWNWSNIAACGCTWWKHLELCSRSGKAWLHTTDVCCLISKVRTTQCVRRYNLEIFFAKKENMSLWVWSMQARCFILWSRAMSFWFRFCWDRLYLVDLVSKQDRARRLKARQGSSAQGASNTNFPASSLQLPRVFVVVENPKNDK